ncbi:HTTM domain-containing protein [Anaerolineales bacterium]
MFISILRFILNGWIDSLYYQPDFHFKYLGLEWVKILPEPGLYVVFFLLLISCILIVLGAYYRVSMTLFFLLFTYIELLDKTYYLNHYYFISVLSCLLIFLPLHQNFSIDCLRKPQIKRNTVPVWTIQIIRLQISFVYFYAGLAKLQADWLFHAQPLSIWLRGYNNLPLIGAVMDNKEVALLFSWAGAAYDVSIPFFLFLRKTRPFAYLFVIIFHLVTAFLLPGIGMFPWLMIALTLIFFDEHDYQKLANYFHKTIPHEKAPSRTYTTHQCLQLFLIVFISLQIFLPLRHYLYPGNVLWTEQGFRFSWRVMLVEKTAYAEFKVHDPESDKTWVVYPSDYLRPMQVKQMSFQPDMILEFAHFIEDQFLQYGDVAVYAEVYVSLNGRPGQLLIDPTVDLSAEAQSLLHKPWILAAPD